MGVDGHFLWDIVGGARITYADALAGTAFAGDWVVGVGAGGECLAALEVFVDYVLCGEFHLIFLAKIGRGEAGRVQIAHNFVI